MCGWEILGDVLSGPLTASGAFLPVLDAIFSFNPRTLHIFHQLNHMIPKPWRPSRSIWHLGRARSVEAATGALRRSAKRDGANSSMEKGKGLV